MTEFRKKHTEIRINGRVAVGGNSVVLGRVRLLDESYTEGAILCMRGGERIDRKMLLLCPPIAVVIICGEAATSLSEICSLGVPCLVVDEGEARCEVCKNKVALVDTEKGLLMLDPSIDTLGEYSSKASNLSRQLKGRGGVPLACPVGKIIKDVRADRRCFHGVEHYLVESPMINDCGGRREKDTFDSVLGFWERFYPELLMINVAIPNVNDGSERGFCELIESVYRAALYGSLAISLSGFNSESELSHALRLFHKTFCILEAEGREFNSYLPRGITISAPIWLMRPSPVTNPDFLLFDIDSLLPSIFSLSIDEILKKEKVLKKELFSLFERYFLNLAPRCEVYLKAEQFLDTSVLSDLARLVDAKAVFV